MRALARWAQRRPLVAVAATAATARAVVILGTHVVGDGVLFEDDRGYVALAMAALNGLEGESAYFRSLYSSVSAFLLPLTWLYRITGPSVVVGQVFVALWSVAGAVALGQAAARALSPGSGLAAGLAVALLPSQMLWSSLVLKDGPVWATTALLYLAFALVATAAPGRVAAPLLLFASSLWLLGHLRLYTLVVACWAVVVALARFPRGRGGRRLALLAMVVLLPLVLGAGPLGLALVRDAAPVLGAVRSAHAQGAGTAVVSPEAGDGGLVTDARHLPRGLGVALLEPYPWHRGGGIGMRLAAAEAVLWYPLLLLALCGAWTVLRSRSPLWLPLAVVAALTLVHALTEGNVGTAFRHRGGLAGGVVLLAVHGLHWLREEIRR